MTHAFGTEGFLGFLMSGGNDRNDEFPPDIRDHQKQRMVIMTEETVLYETPALVEVGDFADVTLGRGTWGWEWDGECWSLCP